MGQAIQGVRILRKKGNDFEEVDFEAFLQITDKDGNLVPIPGRGIDKVNLSVSDENVLLLKDLINSMRELTKQLEILTEEEDILDGELDDN